MKTLLAEGAEAKIYIDGNSVIKHRIKKDYRNAILDKKLRETRTKREAKILQKLYCFGFTPQLLAVEGNDTLIIEKIGGEKLRDVLSIQNYKLIVLVLAKIIRKMH